MVVTARAALAVDRDLNRASKKEHARLDQHIQEIHLWASQTPNQVWVLAQGPELGLESGVLESQRDQHGSRDRRRCTRRN